MLQAEWSGTQLSRENICPRWTHHPQPLGAAAAPYNGFWPTPPHPGDYAHTGLHLRRSSSGTGTANTSNANTGNGRAVPTGQPSGAFLADTSHRQPSGCQTACPDVQVSRKLSDALIRCTSSGFATLRHEEVLRPSDFQVGAAAVQVCAW